MTKVTVETGYRRLGAVSTYEELRPEEVRDSHSGWNMCKSLQVAKNLVCATYQEDWVGMGVE